MSGSHAIADVAARLDMNFVGGVLGDMHGWVQLERAGAGLVGLLHLADVVLGVPMQVISRMLGHSNEQTTRGIYSKPRAVATKQGADVIDMRMRKRG